MSSDAATNGDTANKGSNRYTLSQTLLSDGEPIRSLTTIPPSPPTSAFASSLSDGYQLMAGSGGGLLTSHTLMGNTGYGVAQSSICPGGEGTRHPHQIGALLSIPASSSGASSFGETLSGGYITGCRDGIIRIFGSDHVQVKELKGHGNQVTSLTWLEMASSGGEGTAAPLMLLVSGSWDGTARIWNVITGTCLATLDNHENGVEVVGLPPTRPGTASSGAGGASGALSGRLATTSAGVAEGNTIKHFKVRIWDIGLPTLIAPVATSALRHTVSDDHNGPIRAVAYDIEADVIVTASNDGTVKVRDGTTGECTVTLAHPATLMGGPNSAHSPLLLDVTCLGGGKYAATAEDGTTVIWSTQSTSEPQVLAQPSSVWTILPLPNGDFATGCQDGNIRIYTLDSTRHATAEEFTALETAVAESRQKSAGGPTPEEIAKLPKWEMAALNQGRSEGQVQVFNKGGVAIAAQWSAASATWIEVGEVTGTNQNAGEIDGVKYDHVFPIEIDVQGGGVRTLKIGYNNGQNAFVVAQKFIDDHELDQNYLAQIADYVRQRAGEAGPTLGTDGGGSGRGAASGSSGAAASSGPVPMEVSPPTPQYTHLPIRGYKSFEAGASAQSLSKIVAKAREFNSTLTTNLTDEEIGPTLDSLCETLAATNRYHATKVSDAELAAVGKMVRHWDAERCFPALDLARLVAVHPDAATSRREAFWTELVAVALDKCGADVSGTAAVAVPMLSMRLCANCFKGGVGSLKAVTGQLQSVLKCAESLANSSNKNVRLAVSTVVLNSASYAVSSGELDSASSEQILSVVGAIVGSGLYETEGVVRALIAMGTALLIPGAGGAAAKEKAKSLHMESMVSHVASQHGDKAKGVADEIRSILQG